MAVPCPVRDLDPFSTEFLADPYPAYEAMRATGEVVWLARYDIWAAARHASVSAVLRDVETFCSSAGVGLSNFRTQRPWRRPSPLSEADPPEHSRVRGVVSRVLSASAINRWGDRFRGTVAFSDRPTRGGHTYPPRSHAASLGCPVVMVFKGPALLLWAVARTPFASMRQTRW